MAPTRRVRGRRFGGDRLKTRTNPVSLSPLKQASRSRLATRSERTRRRRPTREMDSDLAAASVEKHSCRRFRDACRKGLSRLGSGVELGPTLPLGRPGSNVDQRVSPLCGHLALDKAADAVAEHVVTHPRQCVSRRCIPRGCGAAASALWWSARARRRAPAPPSGWGASTTVQSGKCSGRCPAGVSWSCPCAPASCTANRCCLLGAVPSAVSATRVSRSVVTRSGPNSCSSSTPSELSSTSWA